MGILNSNTSRSTRSHHFPPELVMASFPPWTDLTSCLGPHISQRSELAQREKGYDKMTLNTHKGVATGGCKRSKKKGKKGTCGWVDARDTYQSNVFVPISSHFRARWYWVINNYTKYTLSLWGGSSEKIESNRWCGCVVLKIGFCHLCAKKTQV